MRGNGRSRFRKRGSRQTEGGGDEEGVSGGETDWGLTGWDGRGAWAQERLLSLPHCSPSRSQKEAARGVQLGGWGAGQSGQGCGGGVEGTNPVAGKANHM